MATPLPISSPPVTERPAAPPTQTARDQLNQLAEALSRSRDSQLLRDYLRLRAMIRVA